MINDSLERALIRVGLLLAVGCLAGCVRAKPPRVVVSPTERVAQEMAPPVVAATAPEAESGSASGATPVGDRSPVAEGATTPTSPSTQPATGTLPTAQQPDRAPLPSADVPPPQGDITHVVGGGDTLSGIAQTYGVSSWSIMKRNGVWDPNKIFVGQKLIIPLGGDATESPNPTIAEHVVVKGDSIAQLARTYRTTPAEIQALNTSVITDPDHLVEGMVLTIQVGTAPPVQTHTVRPGESLSQIAQRYGVTTRALIQTNSLRDPNTVRVGQLLIIPAR